MPVKVTAQQAKALKARLTAQGRPRAHKVTGPTHPAEMTEPTSTTDEAGPAWRGKKVSYTEHLAQPAPCDRCGHEVKDLLHPVGVPRGTRVCLECL